MTQHQMHEIRSGLHLHCIAWGEPTLPEAPMLLVHGLASNARLWDGVAKHLVDLGHYVVAIDQRGHGQSSKPDDGFDMSTVAHDLELFITQLELDRPVVAGQSWGANVVIELAARAPHLVRGVCAVDGGTIQLQNIFPNGKRVNNNCARPTCLAHQQRDSKAPFARTTPIGQKQAFTAQWQIWKYSPMAPFARGSH
jgi:pimeloyl-ACP methyl ester carboxylesterase